MTPTEIYEAIHSRRNRCRESEEGLQQLLGALRRDSKLLAELSDLMGTQAQVVLHVAAVELAVSAANLDDQLASDALAALCPNRRASPRSVQTFPT